MNSSRRPSTALATVSFAAAACGCLAARGAAAFLPPAQLDAHSHNNIWTSSSSSSRRRLIIKDVPSWGRDRHGSSVSFQSSRLYGMTPREEGQPNHDYEGGGGAGDDDKKDEELEAARRRFEDMMNTDTTATNTNTNTNTGSDATSSSIEEEEEEEEGGSSVKKFLQRKRNQLSNLGSMVMSFGTTEEAASFPPPLTSIARERKEAEMEHLASLIYGDEALADLWSLWFAERGPVAAAELVFAEELAGQGPAKWPEAEKALRNLIEEHGVYWVEPVNRLATLYYMQGRLEESRSLCEMVLSVKPWHFGALSGIVLVCTGLGDAQGARLWASRRLPPVPPTGGNDRRAEWVEHAVDEAHKSLKEAEKHTRKSFGKPDKRRKSNHKDKDDIDISTTNIAPSDEDSFTNDTDAWQ